MKNLNKLFYLFWVLFIMPSVIVLVFQVFSLSNQNIFSLSGISDFDKTMYKSIIEIMKPTIDKTTLTIFLNNIIIYAFLWIISIVLFFLFYRKQEDRTLKNANIVKKLALFFYLFFFLKEGVRLGYSLIEFSDVMNMPYLACLLTLILPHAISEFLAFTSGSLFSVKWLFYNLDNYNSPVFPKIKSIVYPAILLTTASFIETIVTPYVFSLYINYYVK